MGVNDPTLHYDWDLPEDGAADDTWGTTLNEAVADANEVIESIDEVVFGLSGAVDAQMTLLLDIEQRIINLQNARATPHYARVSPPTSLATYTTADAIDWADPADFDVGGDFYDSSFPHLLTVPNNGGYNISAQITLPTHMGGSGDDDKYGWELTIHKNAASTPIAMKRTPRTMNGSDKARAVNEALVVSVIDEALIGDTYEVRLRRFGSPTKNYSSDLIQAASDHFDVFLLPSPLPEVLATMQWSTPMLVGRWARLGEIDSDVAGGAANLADGDVYYRPVAVHRKVVLDQVAFGLRIAQTGQQNVRVGIYQAAATTAFPSVLLGQTADMEFDGSAKADYSAFFQSPITLNPNVLYWLTIMMYDVSGGGTFQCEGVPGTGESVGAHLGHANPTDATSGTQPAVMLRATSGLSGALPTIADLTSVVFQTGINWPGIAVHIDSLP